MFMVAVSVRNELQLKGMFDSEDEARTLNSWYSFVWEVVKLLS